MFVAAVATLAIIGTMIPLKTSGFKSFGSQTTETTDNNQKPLQQAFGAIKGDKNTWLTQTDELKLALGSFIRKYGGNYALMIQCIQNESGWSINPKGSNDSGLAFGIAQFHKPTFDSNCQGDYKNPYDQLECFVKMNASGPNHNWSCWKHILQ